MNARTIALMLASAVVAVVLNAQATQSDQGADLKPNEGVKVTIHGYIRDVACLMKYNEALKPTNDCAVMCARAGSPLIVITKDGAIYTPISDSIPDTSQREKLMPFVGSYVEITGEMYQRSGMKGIVIQQIQKTDDSKS